MAPDDIKPGVDGPEDGPFDTYEYVEEIVEYKDTRWLRTLLAVILVILLLLLVGVGYVVWNSSRTAGAAAVANKNTGGKMTWVRSIYGWGNAQDQQLIAPNAVAFSPDGTIWSNSQNRIAIAFTPQGKLDWQLKSNLASSTSRASTSGASAMGAHPGGTPAAKARVTGVQAVYALDVNNKNELLIGDDAASNVLMFSPQGKLLKGWSVPGVSKVAFNDTRVAVLNKGGVGVFDQATGDPVFNFGTRGQGANQFDLPVGIHIDDQNYVYVADTQNQRVRKYTPTGRLVWDAGTVPERKFQEHVQVPKGIFQLPTGVTTDANNRVVVCDAFNYNITVLDGATGKKIASYGDYGQEDGQFDNPSAIAYDKNRDYFAVADSSNNRVQIIRIPGSAPALTPTSAVSKALENPVWILCMPFIILLIAILIASLLSRRRKKAALEAAEAEAA
jgi:hypothetical protein